MKKLFIIAMTAALSACGILNNTPTTTTATTATKPTASTTNATNTAATTQHSAAQQSLAYVRKVNDNSVYAKNIVAKTDVSITANGRDVSVGGKLYMRRGEVIRIQLTPFGLMEVGRLEFTPDYVLLVNRLNKEYARATYSDVDFLRANGLDFYSLQALFWCELFQPGKQQLSDSDLKLFTTTPANHITLTSGKLSFDWTTNAQKSRITQSLITYAKGTQQASTVTMDYADFMPVGAKHFPTNQKVSFSSKQMQTGKMTMQLTLSNISNDSKWDARTTVSDKYKQITPEQFFQRLGAK